MQGQEARECDYVEELTCVFNCYGSHCGLNFMLSIRDGRRQTVCLTFSICNTANYPRNDNRASQSFYFMLYA